MAVTVMFSDEISALMSFSIIHLYLLVRDHDKMVAFRGNRWLQVQMAVMVMAVLLV